MIDYEEYLRMGEPGKAERALNWATAIGLQAVDGLQTSDYLRQTAQRNIEGEIGIDEARRLIRTYYESKASHDEDDEGKTEADKVSANITKILGEPSFIFSVAGIMSIHRRIFDGVFKHAGQLRDYEISKKEWTTTFLPRSRGIFEMRSSAPTTTTTPKASTTSRASSNSSSATC